jgi:shikimate kinase
MKPENQSNVVLTGFMATGKSTVGSLAAKALDFKFIDTDNLIEQRRGKCIADIFWEDGEQAFRKLEEKIAVELGDQRELVIATGGGMMQNPAIVDAFNRRGRIYCLRASLDQILERLSNDKSVVRPLVQVADSRQRIQALLAERKRMYDQFLQLDTTGKSPEQVVEELLEIHAEKIKS